MATNSSILKGQFPVRIKGNTKCPYHKENEVVLLCRECGLLICTTCSITSHKTHIDSFIEISKNTNEQKNSLQDFMNKTENVEIPKLKTEIQSARKEISTSETNYKKLCVNIKKQCNECKQHLDNITEDYLTICDKMEKATTDLLQTHITNLEDRLDALVKLSSECKQTLQTGTAVLVYDSVSEIQEMDFDIPQTPNIHMTEFTRGSDRQRYLEQAMGKLKTSAANLNAGPALRDPVLPPKLPPKLASKEIKSLPTEAGLYKLYESPIVLSQFVYDDATTSIRPTSDGCAWLCAKKNNSVNLINNKGQVLQKIQHGSNITDISLDPTTGRLWFCCVDERVVCEVYPPTTPVRRFTTVRTPVRLCLTKDGRVVVGTQGQHGFKVVMYTADGQMLHTTTLEGSEKRLVLSITQCDVTGNIALVSKKQISGNDTDSDKYRRHIIVFNPTLQLLFHYRGEGIQAREAVTPDKFDPRTVVYDSKGNIVIVDLKRNTIELISGEGKYISTLHTTKGGQGPVGIQKNDVLWSRLDSQTGRRGIKLLKYYSD